MSVRLTPNLRFLGLLLARLPERASAPVRSVAIVNLAYGAPRLSLAAELSRPAPPNET